MTVRNLSIMRDIDKRKRRLVLREGQSAAHDADVLMEPPVQMPFIDSVMKMSVQTQKYEADSSA